MAFLVVAILRVGVARTVSGENARRSPPDLNSHDEHKVQVMKGDTIDVEINCQFRRVLYLGIDTPSIA